MKITKKISLNIFIVILIGILVCILFLGIKKESALLTDNYEKYQNLSEKTNYDYDSTSKNKSSFYKKIDSGENINILLTGDEITCGTTYDNSLYPIDKNINSMLNSNYGVNCSFQYLENNKTTIVDGNDAFDKNTSINSYDLALLSFGYNDFKQNLSLDEFSQKYSDLIGKIRSKNYNCTIIALLPPSLDEDNKYTEEIKHICLINNTECIDLHKYFINSDENYNSLIINDIPTKSGYDLILYSLNELIKSNTN